MARGLLAFGSRPAPGKKWPRVIIDLGQRLRNGYDPPGGEASGFTGRSGLCPLWTPPVLPGPGPLTRRVERPPRRSRLNDVVSFVSSLENSIEISVKKINLRLHVAGQDQIINTHNLCPGADASPLLLTTPNAV